MFRQPPCLQTGSLQTRYSCALSSHTVCPVFFNPHFCILTLGVQKHLVLVQVRTVTVPTSIRGLATNTSHTDCYIQKKKRKKPSRLFLEVQKPIVDIRMDKSTPSTSVFSSGVSNPDPGFCPQGILITPLHSRQTPPPQKAGQYQCLSGGMGERRGVQWAQ